MSVQTQIDRLASAKAAIKTAIEGKGVTVPDATLLDGMAALIASIEAGGGSSKFVAGSFIPESNILRADIEHGLGEIPNVYIIYTKDLDGTQNVLSIRAILLICTDVTDINTYLSFSIRLGANSTYPAYFNDDNGGTIVTSYYTNKMGIVVCESNETTCTFTHPLGSNTKVYFNAGSTYKYLIGRCYIP